MTETQYWIAVAAICILGVVYSYWKLKIQKKDR